MPPILAKLNLTPEQVRALTAPYRKAPEAITARMAAQARWRAKHAAEIKLYQENYRRRKIKACAAV